MTVTKQPVLSRLKHVALIIMGQSPPSSEYSELPDTGLPFLQGTADFGEVHPSPTVYCATPAKVAEVDDILFSVRAPVGQLNIADQSYGIGRGLCAIRCREQLNRRYAWWMLHAMQKQLTLEATGSTFEAITVEDVANIQVPLPQLEIQGLVANFLDRETSKIDALIIELNNLLKLVTEKQQVLISHAVTYGIDPDAPLVDSGQEWIGPIPQHWRIELVRRLFREIDERSQAGEEELLTVSHITGVTPRSEKGVNMFMAETLEGYKVCQPGDLVINTLWAWMGAMGVAFQQGIVSPAYHVYRPKGDFDPRYINYLVRLPNFAKEVTRYSKGVWSSRLRLYPDEFFKVMLPVPPIEDQLSIVDYLDKETAKLSELQKSIEDTIKLSKERRSALISAAVTGSIQVSE